MPLPQFLRRNQMPAGDINQSEVYVVEPTSDRVKRGIKNQIDASNNRIAALEAENNELYSRIADNRAKIGDEAAVAEVMQLALDHLDRAVPDKVLESAMQASIERELELVA